MRYAWFGLAVVLSGFLVWGGCGLTKHAIVTVDKWGASAPDSSNVLNQKAAVILTHIETILGLIDQPCGGGHPCGLIANGNKVLVKTGDAIVTTQISEQTAIPHTIAAMDTLNTSAAKLGVTADAASEALQEGKETLRQINDPDHGVGATLANVNEQIDDLNEYLKSEAVQRTIVDLSSSAHHLSGMSNSADLMLADAQWKEHQLLHPDKVKLTFGAAAWGVLMKVHSLEPPIF